MIKPPMWIGNFDNKNYNCGVIYPAFAFGSNFMENCSAISAFVLCDNSSIT